MYYWGTWSSKQKHSIEKPCFLETYLFGHYKQRKKTCQLRHLIWGFPKLGFGWFKSHVSGPFAGCTEESGKMVYLYRSLDHDGMRFPFVSTAEIQKNSWIIRCCNNRGYKKGGLHSFESRNDSFLPVDWLPKKLHHFIKWALKYKALSGWEGFPSWIMWKLLTVFFFSRCFWGQKLGKE